MYPEVSEVVLSLQETTESLHAFLMSLMDATCPALLRFDHPVSRVFVEECCDVVRTAVPYPRLLQHLVQTC